MKSLASVLRARTAVQTQTPVPLAPRTAGYSGLAGVFGGSAGQGAQLRAMGSVGTLFGVVGGLAEDVAGVEWHLYRRPAAQATDPVEVFSHAALDLWNRPNQFFPRQEFVETGQQHNDLTGEMWWVLLKLGNLPLEMWPIRPDRMEPVPHPQKFLAGYIYRSPDGERIPLRVDEVIQIRRPNPDDLYRGMGPVQALLATLDAAKYSAEWNRNFFLNSAEPGGILQVERRLSDDEFDEMTQRWEQQHRGVARAHRVAVIEQAQWVDRKFSMRDMQFAELGEVNDRQIRQAFRYPKPLLGEVADVNRANAEAMQVVYARNCLVPRLQRIKSALNNELLPMYGPTARDLYFDFESPVSADWEADNAERDSQAAAFVALLTAGVHPDDAADWVGVPRMRYTRPAPTTPPAGGGPPADRSPLALASWARGPRELTAAASTIPDLSGVLTDLDDALAQLEKDYADTLDGQITDLTGQIETALLEQPHDGLAELAVLAIPAVLLGVAVVQGALAAVRGTAATRATDEVNAAGMVTIDQGDVDDQSDQDAEDAEEAGAGTAVATLVAAGLAAAAAREAFRLAGRGDSAKQVAAAVGKYLRGLGGADRRAQFAAALHSAINTGRGAAFRIARDATPKSSSMRILAYEKNDKNRCGPCADIDGHEFDSVDEALRTYALGYEACKGGSRCRGTFYATWS